jgi:hypothetical protein
MWKLPAIRWISALRGAIFWQCCPHVFGGRWIRVKNDPDIWVVAMATPTLALSRPPRRERQGSLACLAET